MALSDRLLRELRDIIGTEHVVTDDGVTERYRLDWTGRYVAPNAVVARPGNTDEVAAVVAVCLRRETAIVPQGGNTGLVGGSVPLSGELVLSTERLTGVGELNSSGGYLTAGAGTTLAEVQRAAREHGWGYGVDIASRDTATLGGTIATNAGGLDVARNGDTRRQVVGVELVTGDAEVVSTSSGATRDNSGYHLPSIVAGSEGTLGIVTKARVRLVPRFAHRTAALLRFAEVADAVLAAEAMHGALPSVESVELFVADGLELVCSAFGLTQPFSDTAGGYVLVEVTGDDDVTSTLAAAVESLRGIVDVAVAEDARGRERLWRYRELHTEAISTVGVPHKLDVALPPGSLAEFVARVPRVVSAAIPGARTWLFGHGGESSLHVNVTGAAPDDETVDAAVLELVAELHGSISAEHGIGRAKLPWIHLAHSPADLRLLAGVKAAFDPAGIMNPAVLLPPVT